jgi:SWI/SNF-related matrix-associated actin-dependent regulator of chromatin subfamily A-like protein 1
MKHETLKLRDFQETGMSWLVRKKGTLLADDPGLGKTIQAIAAINHLKARKLLIICPASVKYNWKKEIERFIYSDSLTIQVVDTGKTHIKSKAHITIVNYDLIKQHYSTLKEIKYAVVICDECHKLKNPETIRTRLILGKGGLIENGYFKMLLTGTPIQNKPIDLYPTISALAPEKIDHMTFYQFAFKYCNAYRGAFGLIYGKPSGKKAAELKEILSSFMLRRRKRDVLKDLPKVTMQHIPIKPTKKLEDLREKEWEMRESAPDSEFAQLGISSSLMSELALAKAPFCLDFIKDALENESDKLVIFAYHRNLIKELVKKLNKFGVVQITGATSSAARQKAVDDFMAKKKVRVFIGQIEAAGEGINGLQTVCSHAIFCQIGSNPKDIEQAVGRLDRMGQTEPVLAQFLLVEDSLEQDRFENVLEKAKMNKKILD